MTQEPEATTILVVDDNEANRALARHTLEDEGYRVVVAADGAAAIAAFEREPPDCVLLDVRMHGLDGFATFERLRALPGGVEVPIAFLTALRDVETFDRAARLGGADFLTKPVQPAELVLRVQAMLKLRRLSAELRDHYEELKRQRDALQRLQLQKERLTAFIVHDLKNPVSSMDLHAQFLLRERGLPEPAREAAAQIRADAAQLLRMISNLLDVSRADEGLLAPRRAAVELSALAARVAVELDAQAKAREVSIAAALEPLTVDADEALLHRILSNLVDNAIRHAPAGTSVRVSASRDDAEGVTIRVEDDGGGVPAELAERIFDPFVQVDAVDRKGARAGHGLGLAFCRAAAVAHGGRAWLEPSGRGACFCVSLP
ncbi:MAG: hybrid sensor histidine kinase/response regulator [Polyangiaceae bacterium]|nr:hybrid sensor histidine kinase/response regulator [Polyangiaceae bacterium]